ncbi:MAG TPA: tetratricopeptide repeat protein [Anaerolineae bacterium]
MGDEFTRIRVPLPEPLTPRERDILRLLAQRKGNRQIADELTLALSTVKWYVRQLYAKLGVANRHEAVDQAAALGLIDGTSASPIAPHNLPAMTTPFVGREEELAALDQLIADPDVRLITILGPGGIGKTRLALATAERHLGRLPSEGVKPSLLFAHGVWFVSLAPLRSASDLLSTLAETLTFRFREEERRTPEQQLLDYLKSKRLLLVLDNFEHLLAGSTFLATVLRAAPGVQMVVTSRERLQLQAEHLFAIDGLALPALDETTDSAITGSASGQLFLHTARRVQPGFEPTGDDATEVARICRLVAGMPLGIELAASWAGMLPLSEIAGELEQSFDLLAADLADVPARHRSLAAALDASWQRLSATQKDAFRQLSLFRGGFTRAAAEQVAGATLPLLVTLVNKSWLTYDPRGDRYRVHELLRQYGQQKLAADADVEWQIHDRLSAYYCDMLQQRKDDFHSGRQQVTVAEIQADLDNIQVAWEWAVDKRNAARIDHGLDGLCRFYQWVGRMRDGEISCRIAAGMLAWLINQEAAPALISLQARVLAWQSWFTVATDAKAALLNESEALLDRATVAGGDTRYERAFLAVGQAEMALEQDYKLAIERYDQALTLYRSLMNSNGVAQTLAGLGLVKYRLSEFDQAELYTRESLSIREGLGDRLGVAEVLTTLSLIRKYQGQAEEAETLQRDVLKLCQELGHPLLEMHAAGDLANTLWWLGAFDEMLKWAEHGASIQDELGFETTAYLANTIARALLHLGRYRESRAISERAQAVGKETGSRLFAAFTMLNLGQIATVEGLYDEAAAWLQESTEALAALWPNILAESLACFAYLWMRQGEKGRAVNCLIQALRQSFEVQSYFSVLYCLPAVALLAADHGDVERALELVTLAGRYGHVANSRWFEDVALRELKNVTAALPDDLAAAARKRGQVGDLWDTAGRLLPA